MSVTCVPDSQLPCVPATEFTTGQSCMLEIVSLSVVHIVPSSGRPEELFERLSGWKLTAATRDIVANRGLLDTLSSVAPMNWLWSKPKAWMEPERLRYVASHSEAIWTAIVNSATLHLHWLFIPRATNLRPMADFQAMTVSMKTIYLGEISNAFNSATPFPGVPSWFMQAVDKAYVAVIGTENVLNLFGATLRLHPDRVAKWNGLIQTYYETILHEITDATNLYGYKETEALATNLGYLLRTTLTTVAGQHTFGIQTDTVLPLLSASFANDLALMLTPVDIDDERGVCAWKRAWTMLTPSNHVLSHDGLGELLPPPLESRTTPFKRAEVYLGERLDGFHSLTVYARAQLTKYHLEKPLPPHRWTEYGPLLNGIDIISLIGCLQNTLNGCLTSDPTIPPTSPNTNPSVFFRDPTLGHYLNLCSNVLDRCHGQWRLYEKGHKYAHRRELIRDILHKLVIHEWTMSALQDPGIHRLHESWLNAAPSDVIVRVGWNHITI